MIIRLRVNLPARPEAAVVVDADERATVADLAEALGTGEADLVRFDGTPLDRHISIVDAGILDGDVISATSPPSATLRTLSRPIWQLEVTAGPDAGMSFVLSKPEAVIGRAPDSSIRLTDEEVSRTHASLRVSAGLVYIRDRKSTNGTKIADRHVHDEVPVNDGDEIAIGLSTLRLSRLPQGSDVTDGDSIDVPAASVEPDGRGGLLLNRVPSLRQAFVAPRVNLPTPPRARERRPLPWLPALIPLVFAGALYFITGTTSFLLFAFLSPLTLGANVWTNRRADRRHAKGEQAEYEAQRSATSAQIDSAIRAEREWQLASAPTGDQVAERVIARTAQLWERSPGDADFLDVRVGVGRRAASIEVTASPGAETPHTEMIEAPLTVSLRHVHVLGIAGRPGDRLAAARSIVVQLAGLHAADEVRIVLLADNAAEIDWEFLRWLPHIWNPNDRRLDIARTGAEIDAAVHRLAGVVAERAAVRSSSSEQPVPAYVVLLESASVLRRRPEVVDLLTVGPNQGVYAIAFDGGDGLIPEERRALVSLAASGEVVVNNFADGTTWVGRADTLSEKAAQRAAVRLAPMRRVGRRQAGEELPSRLTLFELLGTRPTIASVIDQWTRSRANRPAVPVGHTAGGVAALDIVSAGPHALIGGMSGSGKSEFVQTWVASIALHLPPDEFTFLFVEYKGLSAFLRLQHLPHCVGTITNLTPEMTERALTSLTAELKRRQEAFVAVEVGDINTYRAARGRRPELPVMPRLLIVLDEFAEMKQELPQFIDGLIRVARTGRSLGVHLILATQQVGRAVSGEITGNASMRISLRAAVADDSFAVIESNDAARIPQDVPGRAYVKRGEQRIELFQSAWSAGPARATDDVAVTAEPWLWDDADAKYQTVMRRIEDLRTELDDVVETVVEAAVAANIAKPKRPFTQPLPKLITLGELSDEVPVNDLAELVRLGGPIIGRRDDPAAQVQDPYALPLLRGHVAIIGSTQTGRTTALRTAAASWTGVLPPSMLEVHAIDGARSLMSLTALPHAGTVTTADDRRAVRLLSHLAGEVDRRLSWLSAHDVGELLEWWSTPNQDTPIPWIVLIIDRLEEIVTAIERGPAEAALERVLSHGTAAGVTVLASGDETLARNRWQSRFPTRLVLRNTGGLDSIQVGLPPRLALNTLPPGRAYESHDANQVQIAVVGSAAATGAQNDGLRVLGAELAQRWANNPGSALRLRDLPTTVTASELPDPRTADGVVLGLGGDAAAPVEVLAGQLPLLVVGPDRSGRTATLRRMAAGWVSAGRTVTVLAAPQSPLLTNPVAGANSISFTAGATTDWTAILAEPDIALIVDDLHRDDLPDSLVAAMTPQIPRCLFAGAMRTLTLVPEPLLMLARRGTLLFLCPDDPRRLASYEVRIDASSCFTEPVGRGVLRDASGVSVLQVAAPPA